MWLLIIITLDFPILLVNCLEVCLTVMTSLHAGYSIMTFESFDLSLWFTQMFCCHGKFHIFCSYYDCMFHGNDGVSATFLGYVYNLILVFWSELCLDDFDVINQFTWLKVTNLIFLSTWSRFYWKLDAQRFADKCSIKGILKYYHSETNICMQNNLSCYCRSIRHLLIHYISIVEFERLTSILIPVPRSIL